jgi:sugar phosphate isomerase/epimerase
MSVVALLTLSVMSAPRSMPFKLSVQTWTFHRTFALDAIQRAATAGATYVELFPGQKLRGTGDTTVGPWMSGADTQELMSHCKKFGVTPVAFGVTGIDKDYTKAKPLFQWAKQVGIQIINTESVDAIDTIEKLVKEFDIKVGIHNHPKQPNNPNYKVWDPAYVFSVVKDRDVRIGSCADTGHWVRSGIKPVDALKTLKGRVVSSHLKDLNEFSPGGHDMPYGSGVSDIASIIKMYDRMKMTGSVSVEYEHNWDTNVPEVAQCIGFVRGLYGG